MYALKVLSGKNTGKIYPLHAAENVIGRSESCNISIPNKNISKQHAKIVIDKERVLFTDLNSTNGSFINGVKVEVSLIQKGDKIALYDTLLEVVADTSAPLLKPVEDLEDTEESDLSLQYGSPVDQGIYKANAYLEKAAMPPFYLALEKIDFKWLIGVFLFITILATSILSTIPLMNIIKDTVELESKRRASSLAKTIATINTEPLNTGSFSATSVALAYKEPGVKKSYIIRQSNGEIVTPSRMSGQFPKSPLIHEARKKTDAPFHVFKVDSKTILAMHPIRFYSSRDGGEHTQFYSVIVYDAKVLSVGSEKTLSLLAQTLFLSVLFGLIIFYFLYKVVEHPFKTIKRDLKMALQNHSSEMQTDIEFTPMKETYVMLSSLLNRALSGGSMDGDIPVVEADRSIEVQNLCSMLGYASIIISGQDESVLEYNPLFEELTNLYDIKGVPLAQISDQALQQNLTDLVERARITPDQIVRNDFEFSGIPYEVQMHPVMGSQDIAYFVCSFFPVEAE